MTGPDNKFNREQNRIKNLWHKLLVGSEFRRDLVDLEKHTIKDVLMNRSQFDKIKDFMTKYGIPMRAYSMVETYLKTGLEDYSLVRSPIRVYSSLDKKLEPTTGDPKQDYELFQFMGSYGTHIVLDFDVSPTEVKEFVDKHWGDIIEPKQIKGSRSRVRPYAQPDLNRFILELTEYGLRPADIARIINYSVEEGSDDGFAYSTENISDIIKRLRNPN